MKLRSWTLRIHKWIALIIGIQILIWVVGGFIFSYLDIDRVRGDHKVAEWTIQPFDPAKILPLATAADRAGIETITEAQLGTMVGRPVWRLTIDHSADEDSDHDKIVTLDGRTGRVLSPIDEDLASQIANTDYIGNGKLESVTFVEDPPTEYPHPGSAWIARFDDKDETTLYINPDSGEVKSRRSQTWRVFDFFWKLHIMDYDDGEDFNHPLLIGASLVALFFVLSGFTLLFIRLRRKLLMWRARRREKLSDI